MRRFLFLCVMGCTLSACGSLLPVPDEPIKKYTLPILLSETGNPRGMDAPGVSRLPQLVVDAPTVYSPIDSTRIALKPQEQTIDYYADVEWADRLGALIQESLIYSFQNKGMLRGVNRATEGIQANYALKVEVRKFYIEQNNTGHPKAQVDYMAYLLKLPERYIVASQHFDHAQAIQEQSIDSIVKSLTMAHLEASKALMAWVLQRIR